MLRSILHCLKKIKLISFEIVQYDKVYAKSRIRTSRININPSHGIKADQLKIFRNSRAPFEKGMHFPIICLKHRRTNESFNQIINDCAENRM